MNHRKSYLLYFIVQDTGINIPLASTWRRETDDSIRKTDATRSSPILGTHHAIMASE